MFQVSLLSLWEPIRTLSQIEFTFTYVLQISDIRQLNVQATARTFKHKLHLSQSKQWREVLNYALLDQFWETYWGRHNIWLLRPSWDRHTETSTLQRRPSPLRIRSRHLNSLWSSLSEHIATDSWRHQSHVTLLLKVAVSQSTHISYVVPD